MCCCSKVFEKLILKRIHELEVINGIIIGGKQQHGFMKNKSTVTAGLLLQSLIARALDDDCYVALAGIDLSAAFDVVDVKLLIKRLTILGLPSDVIALIKIWLKERFFYVCINGLDSSISVTWYGIVQGSILGPILYAIFISPLFDIENLTCFADDKFPLVWNRDKLALVRMMEAKLGRIMDWLRDSGMKVNESKTDLCLFHRGDTTPITISLNGIAIISNRTINILGVTFDSKLNWADHISNAIKRSMKALNAIRIIRRFFSKKELLSLVTSNFYSLLYYNSEIWHLPTLKTTLKQSLLSASSKALKICCCNHEYNLSFINLHKSCLRATPDEMMHYKLALSLFKLYNSEFNEFEFVGLNFNQILTSRQTNFVSSRNNNLKVGINCLSNRFYILNNKIPLKWFNQSIDTFKIHCKKLFLPK